MQQHFQQHGTGENMDGHTLLSMLQRKGSGLSEHQQQQRENGLAPTIASSKASGSGINAFSTSGSSKQDAQAWQLWDSSLSANAALGAPMQQQQGPNHLASMFGSAQVQQQQQQPNGTSNLQRLLNAAAQHGGPVSPTGTQPQLLGQLHLPPQAASSQPYHGQHWQQLTSSQPLFSGPVFDQSAGAGPFGLQQQQQPDQLLASKGPPPGFGAPGNVAALGRSAATKAPPPGFQHLAPPPQQQQQQQSLPAFVGGSLFSQQLTSMPQPPASQPQQLGLSLSLFDVQQDEGQGHKHQGLSSLFGPSSAGGDDHSTRDLAGLLRNALQSPQQQQQQTAQGPGCFADGGLSQLGRVPQQDMLSAHSGLQRDSAGGFFQQPHTSESLDSAARGLGQPSQLQLLAQQHLQQQQQQVLLQQQQQQLHQQRLQQQQQQQQHQHQLLQQQQQQQHQLLQHLHGMQAGAAAGAAAAGAAAGAAAAAAAVAEQQQYAGNLSAFMAHLQLQQQHQQQQQPYAFLQQQQQQQAQQQHNLQLQHMQQLVHQQQQQHVRDQEELLRQEKFHMLLSKLHAGEQAAAAAGRPTNAPSSAAGFGDVTARNSSGVDSTTAAAAAAAANGRAHAATATAAVPMVRRASSPMGAAQSPGGCLPGQDASMLLKRSNQGGREMQVNSSSSSGPRRSTPALPPPLRLDMHELNEQLLQLAVSLAPTAAQRQRQHDAWSSVQSMLQQLWPEGQAHLFGSAANQLDIGNNNDLDVCLELGAVDESKEARGEVVEKLGEQLEAAGMLQVLAIPRARMPVVKFTHPSTGFKVDITVNNRLALENTKLLRDYAAIDGRLQALVLLIKHWAKRRRCNDAYVGTLSSYAYVLMCIAHLQCRSPPVLPVLQEMAPTHKRTLGQWNCEFFDDIQALAGYSAANTESIAQLLACFFYYWAHQHDYRREVLTVRQGSVLTKAMKGWTTRVGLERHLFCIEDPFELSHDLGRTVHADGCDKLRREFRRAWDIMRHSSNVQQLLGELFAEAAVPASLAGPAPSTPCSVQQQQQ